MENFFGIPINTLMIILLIIFGVSAIVLTVSALRNRVMFKMAARNLPRRRANTVLTVLGLMLAAMIFSASFTTGDTLSHSTRLIAVNDLGEVDIMVIREGIEVGVFQEDTGTETGYFDEKYFNQLQQALENEPKVAGVAPAIIESVPVIAQTGLNEPAVKLLGFDPQYMEHFDLLLDREGNTLLIQDLGEGEVYVSTDVAEGLNVDSNAKLDIYVGVTAIPLTVKGIYEKGGTPSGPLSMVIRLSQL